MLHIDPKHYKNLKRQNGSNLSVKLLVSWDVPFIIVFYNLK